MNKITLLIGLLVCNSWAMKVDDFVTHLQNNHPVFVQFELSKTIKKADIKIKSSIQDWLIGVNTQYKNENFNHSTKPPYSQLESYSAEFFARKKLINLGSEISIKHNWLKQNEKTEKVNSQFSVEYLHSLLKNKQGINDRLALDLSKLNAIESKLINAQQEEVFLQTQLKKFIDLAHAQAQVKVAQNRLKLAERERALIQRKFSAGLVAKVDVLLQEDAYQGAYIQKLQSEQNRVALQSELAITLGINASNLNAEFNLFKLYKIKNNNLSLYLSKHSKDLQRLKINLSALKRQLESDNNQQQDKLDFVLNLSQTGEAKSYQKSIQRQNTSWRIGFNYTHPLGGLLSNAQVEKTQTNIELLQAQVRVKLLAILAQANHLKQTLVFLERRLESSKIRIKNAKNRAMEEKKRYQNGVANISFLIAAQNNEQIVHSNYLIAARDYQKSVVDFKTLMGELL
jgi:hypothetical protein